MDNKPDVGEIFRRYSPAFREMNTGHLPAGHLKAMSALEICRTPELPAHKYKCDNLECNHVHTAYESCGNRHCPKCQFLKGEKWVVKRIRDLLPIQYFHIVFTIPRQLNPLMLRNRKATYDILFHAVSQTLKQLGLEKLKAHIGFFSVLHTWGQTLVFHPHIHCVVTGGGLVGSKLPARPHNRGLSEGKTRWISCPNDFFIHVKVLAARFRSLFLTELKAANKQGAIVFPGKIKDLADPGVFQKLIDQLFARDWVVYSKRPFKRSTTVLKYLSRYAYKIAISNYRIIKVEADYVYFTYKDYSDGNKKKTMKLDVFEFIRRFLLHILPDRFMKIRYYGLLSNSCRKESIALCREVLGVTGSPEDEEGIPLQAYDDWAELCSHIFKHELFICPRCKKGHLILIDEPYHHGRGRSP